MDLKTKMKDAGIVGAGGAGFPSYAKLAEGAEVLVINGAECEPYITSDTRMMVDYTEYVVKGVEILRKWMNSKKFVIWYAQKCAFEYGNWIFQQRFEDG